MRVFGYGSLMWDGWEGDWGCTRYMLADLAGYVRVFNKASVTQWGTRELPGPTLNLQKTSSGQCRGLAFEFPDDRGEAVRSYLKEREGKGFNLNELPIRVETGEMVSAIVCLYKGKNLISDKTVDELVSMIVRARGRSGSCISYIESVAKRLAESGIDDPAVVNLWEAVKRNETGS